MAEQTRIEWCDATMNPWIGCTNVSPGCDHCYAEQQDKFRSWTPEGWGAGRPRRRTSEGLWAQPLKWNRQLFAECGACGWRGTDPHEGTPGWIECPHCGKNALAPARRRVFCASLADVFDNEVDPRWRVDLFSLIARTPQLDWQLLTKRIGNAHRLVLEARDLVPRKEHADFWAWLDAWVHGEPPPNVWLGTTIVNQEEADRDIPKLLGTPARVRFLSMEPLLGPVNLRPYFWSGDESGPLPGVDWVIVGGESGPKARPMHPTWPRSLRDQCAAAGVPFLFKQHGEWLATAFCNDEQAMLPSRRTVYVNPDGAFTDGSAGVDFFGGTEETAWVGKKAAGRMLDGRTHDGFPEVAS